MKALFAVVFAGFIVGEASMACPLAETNQGSYTADVVAFTYADGTVVDYGPLNMTLTKTLNGFQLTRCEVAMGPGGSWNCKTPEIKNIGDEYFYTDNAGKNIAMDVVCSDDKIEFSHKRTSHREDPWTNTLGHTTWSFTFKPDGIRFFEEVILEDGSQYTLEASSLKKD